VTTKAKNARREVKDAIESVGLDPHAYMNPEWPIDAPQQESHLADALDRELAAETFGALDSYGIKHDTGKLPLHLLPVDAIEAITEILDFGARKYAPRNWEKGMDWSRVYRATIGHLFKWWAGKGPDEETGKSHLWHAGCCILFLISYELRGVGQDDRP